MTIVTMAISWLLLVAILIVFEIISLGLTTIWFAGGAFVAAIAAIAGAPLWLQIVLFIGVSVLLLFVTRPLAVKHLDNKIEKTNAEGLVGKKAKVLQEINNIQETGQVKINGMEWTARSSKDDMIIPVDSITNVLEIQGVKLIVEPYVEEKNTEAAETEEAKEEIKEEPKPLELDDDIIKTV